MLNQGKGIFIYFLCLVARGNNLAKNIDRQEAPFYSYFFVESWDSSRNRDFYFQQSSSMQIRRLFSEGDSGKKTASSTPPIHTKPTEQQQQKKNVPDIQPSKTHKVEIQDGETKKQIKGTKIVVNSVVEQNLGNPSENVAPTTTKNQVN